MYSSKKVYILFLISFPQTKNFNIKIYLTLLHSTIGNNINRWVSTDFSCYKYLFLVIRFHLKQNYCKVIKLKSWKKLSTFLKYVKQWTLSICWKYSDHNLILFVGAFPKDLSKTFLSSQPIKLIKKHWSYIPSK